MSNESVHVNIDYLALEELILKFNSNGYYKTIFKVLDGQNGSWDDLYDCLFALYRVNVPGSNPYGIIGGNQSVVLNVKRTATRRFFRLHLRDICRILPDAYGFCRYDQKAQNT